MSIKPLALAFIMLLSLCGCSGASETSPVAAPPKTEDYGEPVTLFLTGTGGMEDEPLYILATEFMETYPGAVVNVDFLRITRSVSEKSIVQRITQSNEGRGADIVVIDGNVRTDMPGSLISFTDLNEIMEQDENFDRSSYFENILDAATTNGRMPYMPLEVEFTYFALNRKYQSLISEPFERYETITFSQMLDIHDYISTSNGGMRLLDCSLAEGAALAYDMRSVCIEGAADFVPSSENRELLRRWIESQTLSEQPTLFTEYDGIRAEGAAEAFLDYPSSDFTIPAVFAGLNGEIFFSFYKALAMNESCKNKALVWEFIKFCAGYYPTMTELTSSPLILPVNRYGFSDAVEAFFQHTYEKNASNGLIPLKSKDEAILDAVERVTVMMERCTRLNSFNEDTTQAALLFVGPLADYFDEALSFEELTEHLEANIREYQ